MNDTYPANLLKSRDLLRAEFNDWFRQSGIEDRSLANMLRFWQAVEESTFQDDALIDAELISANPDFFNTPECPFQEGDLIRLGLLLPGVRPHHYLVLIDFVQRHESIMLELVEELTPPIDWELLTWLAIPLGLAVVSALKLLLFS